jgi:hypothetical protein
MLAIHSFERGALAGELTLLASSLRCKAKGDGGIGIDILRENPLFRQLTLSAREKPMNSHIAR